MAKKGTTRQRSSKAEKPAKKANLKKPNSRGNSRSGGHGGARENAGRKTNEEKAKIEQLKERAINHAFGKQEVVVTTAKGQKVMELERDIALLDMLFTEAIRNKSVAAAREYFDRTRGKAVQPVDLEGTVKLVDQYTPEFDEAIGAALDVFREVIDGARKKG